MTIFVKMLDNCVYMKKVSARDEVKKFAHAAAAVSYWATLGVADAILASLCYWREVDPVSFAETRDIMAANPWVLNNSALINAVVLIWVLALALATVAGLTRFRLITTSVLWFSFMSSSVAALAFGWSFSTLWLTAMAVMAFFAVLLYILERRRLDAEVSAEMVAE